MSWFVKFWGTRGSIPTPGHRTRRYGGNTSCVEVRADETVFICDGGTGLRELGIDLETRTDRVEAHLFCSHTHWDHIQGFPFFTPAYSAATRLHVYDVHRDDDRIRRLLQGQMSSTEYFPVDFHQLGGEIRFENLGSGQKTIDGVLVEHREQTHPGRSFAYSFSKGGRKVAYATDNELDLVLEDPEAAKRDPARLRRIPEPFVRFAAGADLLIADGQYTDEEYPQKVGWGHARATTLVDWSIAAGVKQLAIFHHDPMHGDEAVDAIVETCQARARSHGSDLVVFGAREGLEIKL
jgi:phosphoribosyl 1,2-cyclic phosphodiesterase